MWLCKQCLPLHLAPVCCKYPCPKNNEAGGFMIFFPTISFASMALAVSNGPKTWENWDSGKVQDRMPRRQSQRSKQTSFLVPQSCSAPLGTRVPTQRESAVYELRQHERMHLLLTRTRRATSHPGLPIANQHTLSHCCFSRYPGFSVEECRATTVFSFSFYSTSYLLLMIGFQSSLKHLAFSAPPRWTYSIWSFTLHRGSAGGLLGSPVVSPWWWGMNSHICGSEARV